MVDETFIYALDNFHGEEVTYSQENTHSANNSERPQVNIIVLIVIDSLVAFKIPNSE
jgi:hypothetical protein